MKFPLVAELYPVPTRITGINPIDSLKNRVTVDTAKYYIVTGASLADSSYILHLNNPGDTINWNIMFGAGTSSPRTFADLPPLDDVTFPTDKYTQIGMFTFKNVAAGKYILVLSRAGYVTRYSEIDIEEKCYSLGHRELILGDVNGDGEVTTDDMDSIHNHAAIWKDANYDSRYDLNADGKIDVADVSAAKAFLGFKRKYYKDTERWLQKY